MTHYHMFDAIYNHKLKVLRASLNKTFPSLLSSFRPLPTRSLANNLATLLQKLVEDLSDIERQNPQPSFIETNYVAVQE